MAIPPTFPTNTLKYYMKHIPRIFVEAELLSDGLIKLSNEQMNHINRVLRLKNGDEIRLFNEKYGEWSARIIDEKKNQLQCKENLIVPVAEKSKFPIVACSLINPSKFHFVLEKTTELGVSEIIPIISKYTQFRSFNFEKAQRVIIQACEQSKRITIPRLHEPQSLKNFLDNYSYSSKLLVGVENFSGIKLKHSIKENHVFLIGPEGGFSEEEYSLFEIYTFVEKVSFGKNILRSETAAVAFISAWVYEFL